MSDCNAYLTSAGSTVSCDTYCSSSREDMEVDYTVQPYEEEWRVSGQDFNKDQQKWFISWGF